MGKSKRKIIAAIAIFIFVGGVFVLGNWMKQSELRKPTRILAEYGKVPEFELTNQDGKLVSSKEYAGKVWIADLIFTTCQGTCPMMSQQMLALQRALTKTPDVKLVSFSVDPIRDTPAELAKYATFYGADTKQWTFLTGPVESIYRMAKDGFHLPVDSVGGDQGSPIVHSERFVLVDRTGEIRGYYDGTQKETPQRMLMDIGDLMRMEKQN